MDIEAVDPELRPLLLKLPALDNSKRLVRLLGRVGPRLMREHRVEGVTTRWLRDGSVRVRVYRPDAAADGPGLLWIHGGGLVIGDARQDDRLCSETAGRLGITVVSVRYRLAPESPFPAALDDVTAGWEWLQAHAAELGVDPARVVVGGESAGGGIAASLVQRLHDTSAVQPVAQWLFAPMLDDRTAASRELDGIDHWVWNNSANRFGWSAYLGREPGAAELPDYAVPARREDLTGLPPTWLYAADIELFHDEIVEYAGRLRRDGVDVTLEIVPGAVHGFENWAATTAPAERLLDHAREWLAATLGLRAAA
ncbi:alpha/beta hydrolase [Compostimonas suwonensis]|uniref:Acetyl esterase/lipase n=1 Tax=Compostimonas suwonensis TaxID=1048394 RepID=A0A2M9C096_9MICO|nr:alpha/beta hydrolase [Compostimonas suwonensis]PJJ63756.1 acetyl esterase/lipase [Compostimonas suwonensis]